MFRDKRSRLNLVDVENLTKTSVLNYCTFVQWVPGSGIKPKIRTKYLFKTGIVDTRLYSCCFFVGFADVVVAQSRENMAVWYNMDAPERVTLLPIKGDIVDIVRDDGKTEVIVQVRIDFYNIFLVIC